MSLCSTGILSDTLSDDENSKSDDEKDVENVDESDESKAAHSDEIATKELKKMEDEKIKLQQLLKVAEQTIDAMGDEKKKYDEEKIKLEEHLAKQTKEKIELQKTVDELRKSLATELTLRKSLQSGNQTTDAEDLTRQPLSESIQSSDIVDELQQSLQLANQNIDETIDAKDLTNEPLGLRIDVKELTPGNNRQTHLSSMRNSSQRSLPFFRRETAGKTMDVNECTTIDKIEERAMSVNQLLDVVRIINERCHAEAWKDKHSKSLRPSTVTLDDLNKYVILPNTNKDRCSYVEMVAEGPQPADWFVSHWWGESVTDFVSCVRQHAIDHCYSFGHTYYWVCAYANNQHDLGSANLDDPDKSSFMKAMNQAKCKVLSIVDPKAVKYTRIWCGLEVCMGLCGIYEVYSVPDAGNCKAYDIDLYKDLVLKREHHYTNSELWAGVEYKLKKSLQNRIAVGITVGLAENDGDEDLRFAKIKTFREKYFPIEPLKKIMELKIQDCEATDPDDKKRILEYIKEGNSNSDEDVYEEFNNKLRGKMIASVWRVLLENKDKDEGYNMQNYADTLRKSGVKRITLSMCGCEKFDDKAVEMLADAIPDQLKVFELQAYKTGITKGDPLLHKLAEESRSLYLRELVLHTCALSCDLPATITKLTKLKYLRLESNRLTGCIPEDIGNCTELKYIYLFDNPELGEEIPKSIGKLIKLERLHIGHSNYSGKIPKEYGQCTSLETCFLGNNQFTGPLPPIGNLLKLRVIFFNDNNFDGEIPPEIGNCSSLEVLFLHNNSLEGPLPEKLSKCTNLHTLSIYGNDNLDAKSFYEVLEKCKLRTLYIDENQAVEIDSHFIKEKTPFICKYHKKENNEIECKCSWRAPHTNLATSVNIFRPDDKYASGFAWDLARTHLPELFNEF